MKQSQPLTGLPIWTCQCGAVNSQAVPACRSCGAACPAAANSAEFPAKSTSNSRDAAKDRQTITPGIATPGNGKKTRFRESELQKACETWLRYHGVTYLHLSPMAREKIGWPDLVFCYGKKPFAVELKTATGKVTERQLEMLSGLAKDGWNVAVIRSQAAFVEFVNVKGETQT